MTTETTEVETRLSSKGEQLADYLRGEVQQSNGEIYVKGKFISDDVGLSSKEIGALMLQLQHKVPDLTVEKWSYTSATTWRITTQTQS